MVGSSRAEKKSFGRPVYQLKAQSPKSGEMILEVWELPSPATPRLKEAQRVAGLSGRPMRLMESRIMKRLRENGISLSQLRRDETSSFNLDEEPAMTLALLFRVLAPMKSIDRIRAVADGIDKMSREEAAYWLGMAVHRTYPRRVLAALRLLLTTA